MISAQDSLTRACSVDQETSEIISDSLRRTGLKEHDSPHGDAGDESKTVPPTVDSLLTGCKANLRVIANNSGGKSSATSHGESRSG